MYPRDVSSSSGCHGKRPNLAHPPDSAYLSEMILSRMRTPVVACAYVAKGNLTYDKFNALLPVLVPSFFLASWWSDTYGPGPHWVLLFSFLPVCLSVNLVSLPDYTSSYCHAQKTLFGCFREHWFSSDYLSFYMHEWFIFPKQFLAKVIYIPVTENGNFPTWFVKTAEDISLIN